jgi:hypothetical protein
MFACAALSGAVRQGEGHENARVTPLTPQGRHKPAMERLVTDPVPRTDPAPEPSGRPGAEPGPGLGTSCSAEGIVTAVEATLGGQAHRTPPECLPISTGRMRACVPEAAHSASARPLDGLIARSAPATA